MSVNCASTCFQCCQHDVETIEQALSSITLQDVQADAKQLLGVMTVFEHLSSNQKQTTLQKVNSVLQAIATPRAPPAASAPAGALP